MISQENELKVLTETLRDRFEFKEKKKRPAPGAL
jgi:hypothetical protein